MTFTVETDQNNKISFLDVNITCEQGKFITGVYRSVYQQVSISKCLSAIDTFKRYISEKWLSR